VRPAIAGPSGLGDAVVTEPCDLEAVEARRLIGARRLSPVELLESCIGRIEAVNPAVNAVVATALERARAEARAAEQAVMRNDDLPPLHGLPIGIKDVNETAGLATTWGCAVFRDHVPARDDNVVAAVRRAGGIVFGKTNTPEFAAGANTVNGLYGATVNPFDTRLTCGGSSGGSAVAVATGMMPLAQGTDVGGSLRLPAAFCGVVGLRASPGLVPYEDRPLAFTTFDIQGPIARSVADAALLLSVLAAGPGVDPMAYPHDAAALRDIPSVDLATLRVAFSEDLGVAPVSRAVRAVFRDRAARIGPAFAAAGNGHPDLAGALDVFWHLRGQYMLARFRDLMDRHGAALGANPHGNYRAALGMSVKDMSAAHAEQMRLFQALERFFAEADILICPCSTVPPFPVEQSWPAEVDGEPMANYMHWGAMTTTLSVTGHPVVALPCGRDAQGTPFGLQIVAPMHRDRFVLGVARALEQAIERDPPLARPRPDLAALSRAGQGDRPARLA
jgi:Asp-tRNA(Asn)/Glu-tRNA(Gln) amidotransferase A subunit family amidase